MMIRLKLRSIAVMILVALYLSACTTETTQVSITPTTSQENRNQVAQTCPPTRSDAEGPYYKPDAPLRDKVGEGYVLQGMVLSSAGCVPIPGAQLEFWLAGSDGEYSDDYRATLLADDKGAYRFESNLPPPYSGRPPHIHIRISAAGYQTLVTQHYPNEGETSANMDIVLIP